ncbi:MAG: hypothetical protein H6687_01945 [Bacillales bacterium]|nr:hypothetical protein [Bacillales bacterium]
MKRLTQIRLINWHYFDNETIQVKNNTLLTGQNASGKSTILDAISFVLTAGDQNFNIAANEKGKRDLRGYVKCKLGSLDQEYLRDYDLSGHICLEFYSEKQDKYFCLGTIIDIVGETTAPKVIFYIIDGPFKDEYLITEDYEVKSIAEFKRSKVTPYVFATRKEAKSAFRQKMGGISEKYFTLLPKALAFKPITDVKDYIYQHLLEEKEIDVENIKDSIRSYKEFETILKTTKAKIEDLEKMKDSYLKIKELKENQDYYSYLLKLLEKTEIDTKILRKSKDISKNEKLRDSLKQTIQKIQNDKDDLDDKSKVLYSSLSKDKEFRANELYDKDIKNYETSLALLNEKAREYERRAKDFHDSLKPLSDLDKNLYQKLSRIDLKAEDEESINKEIESLSEASEFINEKLNQLSSEEIRIQLDKKDNIDKIQSVYSSLNLLKQNDIPYRPEIVSLRREMENYLKNLYGEDVSVHILAEIIEISDPSWQNTIEDLLANQRFTLIVEPKYFDDALDCYNNNKSKKLYGVNLLNTKKIQSFDNYQPKSLASIIETDNVDARHYINYIVGNLIMVDNVHDLDKYQQAITKDGMLYRGFVTRYLNPNTEKPFIGKGARAEQLDKYTKAGQELKDKYNALTDRNNEINECREIIKSLNIPYLKELLKNVEDKKDLEIKLEEAKTRKNHLSLTSVNDLRKEYEDMRIEIRKMDEKCNGHLQEVGGYNQAIQALSIDIISLTESKKTLEGEIAKIETENISYHSQAEALFNEDTAKDSFSSSETRAKYEDAIKDSLSSIKSMENGLVLMQVSYIAKYNCPFGSGYEEMQKFMDELEKLVKSELVKYESKVRESREEAEKLFKEDFLSKLRSYILEAQDEIEKINETLLKISFGKDKYQFVFPKSKEFGAIYDMITDNADISLGYSIFNEEFEKKYNQELEELFDNLSMDEENSKGNLNRYTDYRTYMDYDIKIISGDDVFYFSNISKEKSGGETQIPFYVAILASFVRLFDKAEKSGLDDSVGLLLFDEVFDKMDAQRTDAMMEFISKLNVQILLACPPQKMEGLSAHTDTTIAVFRSGKKAGCCVIKSK